MDIAPKTPVPSPSAHAFGRVLAKWKAHWDKLTKQQRIAVIVVSVVIVVLIAVGIYLVVAKKPATTTTNTVSGNLSSNSGPTRQALLTGELLPASAAEQRPAAVMIENLASIRPQSGLGSADMVYEALVEGGITRFVAIFGTRAADKIGPVRSARAYYLDWVQELFAPYFHVGGSPQAMQLIKDYGVRDLDQFYNSAYYWRDRNIGAPHNVFTKTELIRLAIRDKDYPQSAVADIQSWQFKDEAGLDARGADGAAINLDYSSASYAVKWVYNRERNVYLRFDGGVAHTDKNGGEQISAKNVVVQKVKAGMLDEKRLTMDTIGEGDAVLFRDGNATTGTWKKTGRDARTRFYDASGKEMVFDRGNTWVQVIPPDHGVTY